MTAIRIQVTAEDIASAESDTDASDGAFKTDPIEVALARIAGVPADVSSDNEGGYLAAIGGSTWPGSDLVVSLPATAVAYLDRWWDFATIPDPIAFDLELDDWLVAFLGRAS